MKTEISPGGYIDQTGESAFPNVGHRTPWSNTPNVTLQFGSYVYEVRVWSWIIPVGFTDVVSATVGLRARKIG